MEQEQIVAQAKEAYVISQQLAEMQESMDKAGANLEGYHAFARTYTKHLERAKEILQLDPTIAGTIDQLVPYDATKRTGYRKDFQEMRADIPILRSALRSFFDFNLPAKEKERVGFK